MNKFFDYIKKQREENPNQPLSFRALLMIMFIYLKLTNQIDWSWWWVMSPAWLKLIWEVIGYWMESLKEYLKGK